MRVSDIVNLGMEYLIGGIVAALFLGAVFAVGYFFIYKKLLKGNRKVSWAKLGLYGLFVCYLIVVLGATMFCRGNFWQSAPILQLFYSYREAWNSFSATAWRNIILNILMMVPFGFMLPFLHKSFTSARKTWLTGALFVLLIECGQYVLKRGIFEADDLFDNLLGVIVGYGCYRMFRYIIGVFQKKREKLVPMLLYQLPLFITILSFAVIFLKYENQELGNLSSAYIIRQNEIQVSSQQEYSDEKKQVMVYQLMKADVEETEQFAENFFAGLGMGMDESRTDIYENTAIYYSEDNRISLWVKYDGLTYSYTDFEEKFGEKTSDTDAGGSEEEVAEALAAMNVYLPEGVLFENLGEGNYRFTADKLIVDGVMYDGMVICTYLENGKISDIDYNLIAYEDFKCYEILSEKEAFEKIEEGQFNLGRYSGEYEIVTEEAVLEYEIDSKGFYQPVYAFKAMVNGTESKIRIPAIQ